jgi:hypothetical protein
MAREKGHDEMFCRSCEEPIKKKAEVCPECGVPNDGASAQSDSSTASRQSSQRSNQSTTTQSTPTTQETPHDPSQYSTTVSENWNYAVAASLALWILGFAMPEEVGGFFFLVGWVIMPVSIYFDRQWVAATTEWNPDETTWLVLAAIPLVNIVAGAVYLFRRYNLDQISSADGGSTAAVGQNQEDRALDDLRERYANGELSDAEFERKLEAIVGTEDAETAEMHVDRERSSASDE